MAARRWLWIILASVGLGLAGQMVDLAWHAKNGRFVTAADVLAAHWLAWLALVVMVVACIGGMRSGHARSTRGFAYILIAAAVNFVAHMWNFWGHVNGEQEPIVPHVLLAVSGVGVLVAAGFTAHLMFGRDERPLTIVKQGAR